MAADTQSETALPPRWFVYAALAVLISLKLSLFLFARPLADEAYYWMWGHRLALSYQDHPPLLAWSQRAAFELLGWSLFALRALSLVTIVVSASIVAYWANRIARGSAATAVMIMLASPMFFLFQTIAYPDHLLVSLLLVSGHFFALYVRSASRKQAAARYLFAAAIAVGFAGLTKYNAVFVGLGYAIWFVSTSTGRAQLRTPGPWLAGLVAVAIQLPVLLWNMNTDFSSFRFHLNQRYNSGFDPERVALQFFYFLLLSVAFLSPFLLTPLWRFLRWQNDDELISTFQRFARPALLLSLLTFTTISLFTQAFYYWNIAGLALFLPVASGLFISRRGIMLHAGYGMIAAALIVVNYAIIPVVTPFGGQGGDDRFYGWDYIAREVKKEASAHKTSLLLTSHFTFAAELGFELRRTDVFAVSSRADQYDYWFEPDDYAGADAIILDEKDTNTESELRNLFESVTLLKTLTTERFGYPLRTYRLYLGKNLGGR